MSGLEQKDNHTYINVLASTGDFRMVVDENTEGAKLRKYETSDGKKGEKWELAYKSIGGIIKNIEFFDGDYGRNLFLTFDFQNGEEDVVVSLGTNTPFGEDVLKKFPNIDFSEEVKLSPYSFEDENGKLRRGISIVQDGEKILGAFYDPEKKKNLLGFPEPEGDTSEYDKEDWIMYFTIARKFLVKYAEKNIPKWIQVVENEKDTEEDVEEEVEEKTPKKKTAKKAAKKTAKKKSKKDEDEDDSF